MNKTAPHVDLQAAAKQVMLQNGFEPDFPPPVQQQVSELRAHPPQLAAGSDDNLLRLWKLWEDAPPTLLRGHADTIHYVSFAHNGRALLSAAGVALLGYLLHVYVVARIDGGLSALLAIGELRALYVTLAGALVLGMRLAFSHDASARRN